MLLEIFMLLSVVFLLVDAHGDDEHDHDHHHHHHDDGHGDDQEPTKTANDLPKIDPDEVEYHKGSLCGYCEYCKVTRQNIGTSSGKALT